MSCKVTTRAQKRRMGQRDLWDVIVNNDDVCFEHILPRLNRSDVKFLFEVNSETRALIKRSSRVGELKKRYIVEEISSISTLEFAWENQSAPWGDSMTAAWAAANGHLHILEYLVEREYDKFDAWACGNAAKNGHLDCLKFLHETAKAPWDQLAVQAAHENNHSECLQYLLDNDCPLPYGWRYEHGVLHTS